MDAQALLLGIVIGAAVGVLAAFLWLRGRLARAETELARARATLEAERRSAVEKAELLKRESERLKTEFEALAAKALDANSARLLQLTREAFGKEQQAAKGELELREQAVGKLVEPLAKSLEKVNEELARIEKARAEAYGGLNEQLRALAGAHERLQAETGNLVQALRRPSGRGQWGEMQLRRVVEMAGMLEHVDFLEQVSSEAEAGRLRPDMVIKMPGGGQVVVDAKTPLEAYLKALDAPDDATRQGHLADHARQVRDHVRSLAGKAYQDQLATSPEFTVMFLPSESIFYAALEKDPGLIESGVNEKVLLATPTTLIALLRAVYFGWRQEALAKNAQEISDLGRDLYERMGTLAEHFADLGKKIGGSVEAYNKAVGTLEKRVLPSARRFPELGVRGAKSPALLESLDTAVRPLQAPEMGEGRSE
jgi:DNA recombination protein RmuC